MKYTESFIDQDGNIPFDERTQARVENIYAYYKENLPDLFFYK